MSLVYAHATRADGYCGYRCLAALRDTTMKKLIKDVLSALLGQEGEQITIINVVERKKELQRVSNCTIRIVCKT